MIKVTRAKEGVNIRRVHRITIPNLFLLLEPVAHWLIMSVTTDSTPVGTAKGNKQSKHPITLMGWFMDEGTWYSERGRICPDVI